MEKMVKLFIFFISFTSSALPTSASGEGARLHLRHVIGTGRGLTPLQQLQQMAIRSRERATALSSSSAASAPVHPSPGAYLVDISIGTPPTLQSLILDTGSDLVWVQCNSCLECFQQPLPVFDPLTSSTYSKLPCTSHLCQAFQNSCHQEECTYFYAYQDGTTTGGTLSSDTFTVGTGHDAVQFPNLSFGCGEQNRGRFTSNETGIIGFGREKLSFISQLNISKFSYCLSSFLESNSLLFLGSLATINSTAKRTTPLTMVPANPSFYYLSLNGISVGTTRVLLPNETFAILEDGTGGVIIDSGTTLTALNQVAFTLMAEEFKTQVNLPVDNNVESLLCFSTPNPESVEMPKLTFHFQGADLEFPRENYILGDKDSKVLCLTIVQSSESTSIIGNMQQHDMQILYDLKDNQLSFVAAQCDLLP